MLNDQFRPMLSPIDDPKKNPNFFDKLHYPLLCSPKLDGIRAVTRPVGDSIVAVSRTNKALPSLQVQEEFTSIIGLDGELIEGRATDFGVYNRTQSHVMSADKPGNLSFNVFDYIADGWSHLPYYQRLEQITTAIWNTTCHNHVFHVLVDSYEELLEYESAQLALGYEGIMMRDPEGRYKNGRATMNEGIIFKLKRFEDDECVVIGFVERTINNNKKTIDEQGFSKRSAHQEGKALAGSLGKFIVLWQGIELEVGPGAFKHNELQAIWDSRELYVGMILKFRYFSHGIKDKPRFPRALGWRSPIDMGE